MTIYLIRHGEAAQAWDEAPDPILSDNGKIQAQTLAENLKVPVSINTNFAEIPSPGIVLKDRRNWLKALFTKTIHQLEQPQLDWRNNIIQGIKSLEKDTLIFSHFMTINAIVGWISRSEKVVNYYPNYCSITRIEKIANQYYIRELGAELTTIIQ